MESLDPILFRLCVEVDNDLLFCEEVTKSFANNGKSQDCMSLFPIESTNIYIYICMFLYIDLFTSKCSVGPDG